MPRGGQRPVCDIEGCDNPHMARGLCSKHYQREFRDPTYQARWRAANVEERRAYQREWYQRNAEAQRTLANARRIRAKYGLSMEEYDAIIARGCAICGTDEGTICVDHDHASGRVRDALCTGCNVAIGAMAEDPDRLRLAAEYIEQHRAPRDAKP
jgi:hypothetical protein